LEEDIPEAFTAGPEIHSIFPLIGKANSSGGVENVDLIMF
jgi:hypothetical protein